MLPPGFDDGEQPSMPPTPTQDESGPLPPGFAGEEESEIRDVPPTPTERPTQGDVPPTPVEQPQQPGPLQPPADLIDLLEDLEFE
jgi:hypothetical protein